MNRSRGQSRQHTTMQLLQFAFNTGDHAVLRRSPARRVPTVRSRATSAAKLLLAPVALYLLARSMRPIFSATWLKKSLLFGLPLIPHFFAGWMLTFSDRWIIGHYRSLAEVGLYSLAYNLSMILNMFITSINTAWGPVYYDLAGSDEGRAKLPRLTTVFAAAISIVAMGYLLFSREALLLLATERYHAAAPLVPIIVAGYFAFGMYVVMSTGIFYARKTKYIPFISAVAAAVNIGLNLLLVPQVRDVGRCVDDARRLRDHGDIGAGDHRASVPGQLRRRAHREARRAVPGGLRRELRRQRLSDSRCSPRSRPSWVSSRSRRCRLCGSTSSR